jgi:hypothetical protein
MYTRARTHTYTHTHTHTHKHKHTNTPQAHKARADDAVRGAAPVILRDPESGADENDVACLQLAGLKFLLNSARQT